MSSGGEDPAVGEGEQGRVPPSAAGDPEGGPVIESPAVMVGPPQGVDRAARAGPEEIELVVAAADRGDRAARDGGDG
jgi:hypothetical protein